MNLVQNQVGKFNISNALKALGLMVVIGTAMVLMGVQNGLAIWLMPTVVVVVLAKAADMFSTKHEAIVQAEKSAFQRANVISLADHRAAEEVVVAA